MNHQIRCCVCKNKKIHQHDQSQYWHSESQQRTTAGGLNTDIQGGFRSPAGSWEKSRLLFPTSELRLRLRPHNPPPPPLRLFPETEHVDMKNQLYELPLLTESPWHPPHRSDSLWSRVLPHTSALKLFFPFREPRHDEYFIALRLWWHLFFSK